MDAEPALAAARAALAAAVQRLATAGAAPEQLVQTVPARRALGVIPRRETFRRIGEGYLVGALLVTAAGDVLEPGRIIRASRQVLPGHQSESARARRELRQRLLDARLPEGSTVVIDPRPLPFDDPTALAAEHAPLVLREIDGAPTVLVRWMPSAPDAALRPLDAYLAERLDLALGALTGARAESEHP
ncbi:hypothetical protein [Microcella frigidaquae]|uniref:Uncharacterized protein n=1 Tax=Microcella frigidaquae TaxID=424758 RepID=A0A840XP97_9MICO|nr:hypothetical protein [Microcella frigidaquae]MBB5618637.1 hypothetical protein [Microcella frigidaquae]NHN44071.1 hypothetical protein [Microcella frigidaquae]